MKVIDLLNKIANDQNYRPDFMYHGTKYKYQKEFGDYQNEWNYKWGAFAGWCVNMILNDEVEIIEEDKPIEKLKIAFLDNYEPNEIDRKCWNRLNEHQDKINEIIDKVNKLKKESDK